MERCMPTIARLPLQADIGKSVWGMNARISLTVDAVAKAV